MSFGVTLQGFVRPRLSDIQAEIIQTMVTRIGSQLNTLPQSVISNLIGVFAEREDLIWQAAEDAYNSQYPDLAFGVSLDNAASLTGAIRLGALPSTVQGQLLFGTAGTLVPAGTQVSVDGAPTNIFATDFDITLVAGTDCIQHLNFSATPTSGNFQLAMGAHLTSVLPFNVIASALQTALQALPFGAGITVTGSVGAGFVITFAGNAGKQVQAALIPENNTLANISGVVTPTVTIATPGVNQGSVSMTATHTGPILAPSGELTVIVTPIMGLVRTYNPLDAVVGRDVETDNEFKQRRRLELESAGAAALDAIRSKILEVAGVTTAIIFENDSFVTDGFGRPPKSINAVVEGGTDLAIQTELLAVKAAGILSYGSVCGNITDSQGQVHQICFDRPSPVNIYIIMNVVKNGHFPSNGIALIQEALVSFGNALGIGQEVVVTPYLISSIATIPGIESAQLLIGTAPSPTLPNNIAIAANQVAAFDTSRIVVNVS